MVQAPVRPETWELPETTDPTRDLVIPSPTQQLALVSQADRAMLTAEVIERWTRDLAPEDIDFAQIATLERRRRKALETLRAAADLTEVEFKLVRFLQRHEGRTLTYIQIARHVWGQTTVNTSYGYATPTIMAVQRTVCAIRGKLEIDPVRPQHIATMRGVGYRWYALPPALDDGEDYAQRARETDVLREHVQRELGIVEGDFIAQLPDGWAPGMPLAGPELPRHKGALTTP